MEYGKITVTKQDKRTVTGLWNESGYYVLVKPHAKLHKKSKLIIRNKGSKDLELDGRQIASLKRVLAHA